MAPHSPITTAIPDHGISITPVEVSPSPLKIEWVKISNTTLAGYVNNKAVVYINKFSEVKTDKRIFKLYVVTDSEGKGLFNSNFDRCVQWCEHPNRKALIAQLLKS